MSDWQIAFHLFILLPLALYGFHCLYERYLRQPIERGISALLMRVFMWWTK